ncbi:hypothetical protein GCM10020000_76540 [Streptomyces olivoverticillatus]
MLGGRGVGGEQGEGLEVLGARGVAERVEVGAPDGDDVGDEGGVEQAAFEGLGVADVEVEVELGVGLGGGVAPGGDVAAGAVDDACQGHPPAGCGHVRFSSGPGRGHWLTADARIFGEVAYVVAGHHRHVVAGHDPDGQIGAVVLPAEAGTAVEAVGLVVVGALAESGVADAQHGDGAGVGGGPVALDGFDAVAHEGDRVAAAVAAHPLGDLGEFGEVGVGVGGLVGAGGLRRGVGGGGVLGDRAQAVQERAVGLGVGDLSVGGAPASTISTCGGTPPSAVMRWAIS